MFSSFTNLFASLSCCRGHDLTPLVICWIAERDRGHGRCGGDGGGQTQTAQEMWVLKLFTSTSAFHSVTCHLIGVPWETEKKILPLGTACTGPAALKCSSLLCIADLFNLLVTSPLSRFLISASHFSCSPGNFSTHQVMGMQRTETSILKLNHTSLSELYTLDRLDVHRSGVAHSLGHRLTFWVLRKCALVLLSSGGSYTA